MKKLQKAGELIFAPSLISAVIIVCFTTVIETFTPRSTTNLIFLAFFFIILSVISLVFALKDK